MINVDYFVFMYVFCYIFVLLLSSGPPSPLKTCYVATLVKMASGSQHTLCWQMCSIYKFCWYAYQF